MAQDSAAVPCTVGVPARACLPDEGAQVDYSATSLRACWAPSTGRCPVPGAALALLHEFAVGGEEKPVIPLTL